VDLRYIQELLRHESSKTTEIYAPASILQDEIRVEMTLNNGKK
jgi:site-specific recombinase XerD